MRTFKLNNNSIDKFFGFIYNLDLESKKRLIFKLNESIKTEKSKVVDLKDLYGAWVDNRDADDIINEINKARVNNNSTEEL